MGLIIFLIKAIVVTFLILVLGTMTVGAYSFFTNIDVEDGLTRMDLDKFRKNNNK